VSLPLIDIPLHERSEMSPKFKPENLQMKNNSFENV